MRPRPRSRALQRPLGGAAALCALGLAVLAAPADQDPKPAVPPVPALREPAAAKREPAPARADEREQRARACVQKSLACLARLQARSLDGSFPATGAEQPVPIAVAALAALAYMAGGSEPERGPQGAELGRAIDYLVSHCDLTPGSPTLGYISSDGDPLSRMHGHGFATLALSQALTMSPATPRGARLRAALEAAVRRIEASQGAEGGWFYEPKRTYDHENSVTICLVQALRGARGAGIQVDPAVIQRAVEYVQRCQNEGGSFQYALNNTSTSAALTAAGLATLNSIGIYDGPTVSRAMDALARELAVREDELDFSGARSVHYERLYVAQALWQAHDTRPWESWRTRIVARLEAEQAADGSWHDARYGDAYATAMHSLVLSIPAGMLPIFQR